MRSSLRLCACPVLCLLLAASLAGCAEAEQENQVVFPGGTPRLPPAAPAPGLTTGCNEDGTTLGRLLGRVYAIAPETRRMPSFDALSPVGTLCLDRLDVTERRGQPGFPGIVNRSEWFAVDSRGAFVVDEPGTYSFRLTSDDGSELYLDGALVIRNDGYHVTHTAVASSTLGAGPHSIAVPYWQGPGPLALVLEVAPAGGSYHVLRVDEPLRASTLAP